MNWREQLRTLEEAESFDIAIFFLQQIIEKNPHEMDPYLALIYLLGDTIMEPHTYDCASDDDATRLYYRYKSKEYGELGNKYQAFSYLRFHDNAEYLFICAYALVVNPWSGCEFRDPMWKRAYDLEPNNPIYQGAYYGPIYKKDPNNSALMAWARLMTGPDSPLNTFDGKGRAWEYAQWMAKSFPERVLEEASKKTS